MNRSGWIAALVLLAVVLWIATAWNTRGERGSSAELPEGAPYPGGGAQVPSPPSGGAEAEPAEPSAAPAQPAPAPAAPPAAPAPAAPAPTEPSPEPAPPTTQLPAPERSGPVDELKPRFANESRDPAATGLEKQIEAAFRVNQVPPELLESVQCRRSICRVRTRWTPERSIGFMAAFTALLLSEAGGTAMNKSFDPALAISPEGEVAADGQRTIDVYIRRLVPQ